MAGTRIRIIKDSAMTAAPAAIARYARDGREPRAECGAPAMQRWLSEARFEDWLTPDAPAAPAGPVDPAVQARRERLFRDTGTWEPEWGPRPAANDTTAPERAA